MSFLMGPSELPTPLNNSAILKSWVFNSKFFIFSSLLFKLSLNESNLDSNSSIIFSKYDILSILFSLSFCSLGTI